MSEQGPENPFEVLDSSLPMPGPKRRKRKGLRLAIFVLLAGALGAAGYLERERLESFWRGKRDLSNVNGELTYKVTTGDLRISFTERGNIKASKSVQIFSEVEGMSTIVNVVPEGTFVKEGDVLVELDSSELTYQVNQQQITVDNAEAGLLQAQEQVAIQKSLNESSIQQAELDLMLATIDLCKYEGRKYEGVGAGQVAQPSASGGSGGSANAAAPVTGAADPSPPAYPAGTGAGSEGLQPAALQAGGSHGDATTTVQKFIGDNELAHIKARADVIIATQEVTRARNQYEWTKKLAEKGYVTGNELIGDELTWKKAVLAEEQSKGALELFEKFTQLKDHAKYESAVEQATAALDRAKRKAQAELSKADADLKAKESTMTLSKKRLKKLQDQLEKTTIKAPQDGMVVYSQVEFWRRERMIEKGAEIHENQLLMTLPDVSTMAVQVQVHESWIDQVREGLPAFVSIDALPNLKLRGKVTKVGLLPDSVNRWLNPDLKVYQTEITIDEGQDIKLLKPGMSAKVEIVITVLKDVLFVPVQSVTTIDKEQVSYELEGDAFVPRKVQGGMYNESYIQIVSGLSQGDIVQLNAPPPKGTRATEAEENAEALTRGANGLEELDGGRGDRGPGRKDTWEDREKESRRGGRGDGPPVMGREPGTKRRSGELDEAAGEDGKKAEGEKGEARKTGSSEEAVPKEEAPASQKRPERDRTQYPAPAAKTTP